MQHHTSLAGPFVGSTARGRRSRVESAHRLQQVELRVFPRAESPGKSWPRCACSMPEAASSRWLLRCWSAAATISRPFTPTQASSSAWEIRRAWVEATACRARTRRARAKTRATLTRPCRRTVPSSAQPPSARSTPIVWAVTRVATRPDVCLACVSMTRPPAMTVTRAPRIFAPRGPGPAGSSRSPTATTARTAIAATARFAWAEFARRACLASVGKMAAHVPRRRARRPRVGAPPRFWRPAHPVPTPTRATVAKFAARASAARACHPTVTTTIRARSTRARRLWAVRLYRCPMAAAARTQTLATATKRARRGSACPVRRSCVSTETPAPPTAVSQKPAVVYSRPSRTRHRAPTVTCVTAKPV
jgi:hypothetical protein